MERKVLPILLDKKEVAKLLNAPSKNSITGIRNRAILRLMLNTGLRVSEVSKLKKTEIDLNFKRIRVTQGKGAKDREIGFPAICLPDLERWEKHCGENFYYFHTHYDTKVSIRYIEEMVARMGKKAGIKKRVYPHLLRHIFATDFYRQFKDIEGLRKFLGHEDTRTTQIYVNLSGVEVAEYMEQFVGF